MIDKSTSLRRNPYQRRRLLLHITAHICQSLSLIAAIMSSQAQASQAQVSSSSGADQTQSKKSKAKKGGGKKKGGGRKDALLEGDGSTGSQEQGKTRAFWTDEETRTLVNYLYAHRSKSGEGGFPPTIFHSATVHVNQQHPNARPKDQQQVETKYNSGVSRHSFLYQSLSDVKTAQRHHEHYHLVPEVVRASLGQCQWGQHRPRRRLI